MNNYLISLPLMILGLAGCNHGDLKDLKHFVAIEKQQQPSVVKPLPQPVDAPTYEYVAGNDPFIAKQDTPQHPIGFYGDGPQQHAPEALEAFPLDSLRMVGTVEQQQTMSGLVRSADGTVHQVRLGHYLGQNYGRITDISNIKIVLTEKIKHADRWEDRKAALALGQ